MRGFRDFFKVLTADQGRNALVGPQVQPQCHPVARLSYCSSDRSFRVAVYWKRMLVLFGTFGIVLEFGILDPQLYQEYTLYLVK